MPLLDIDDKRLLRLKRWIIHRHDKRGPFGPGSNASIL